jgi:outer membrane protein TolC
LQTVTSNWHSFKSAQAQLDSRKKEIKSAQRAYEGVKEEAHIGSRTILDVLNADQEMVNAQIALAQAERDKIVSQFALAATLGLLTPESLNIETTRSFER